MNIGYIVEHRLVLTLLEQGHRVSKPLDPLCFYDLVVDNSVKFLRLQTKSCSIKKRNRYRADIACGATNKKRPYPVSSLDFFVVFIPPENSWYIIPLSSVTGQKWVSLYPHDRRGKYEVYRENWQSLCG